MDRDSDEMMQFAFIHDLIDSRDPQGRTYKEINLAKQHNIPIGTLVESIESGVRMFVVYHHRDCDGTPLYCLGPRKDDTVLEDKRFWNRLWWSGHPEYSLEVVK